MRLLQYVDRPGLFDLGWGHPHPDALPADAWAAATDSALRRYGYEALSYGYGAGPGPLRAWLADRIERTEGRACDPATIFIAAGASHGVELVAAAVSRPGDVVVVESPTYHLALRILTDAGLETVAAPTDAYGLDPDGVASVVVAARAAGRRVSLLYLVPTFGNPTGVSLPDDRRRALVDVAARLRLTIVEDDTYRELGYDGPAPPSLWSVSDHVIRVGSFSKTVAPGLRLGWINGTVALVTTLEERGYVYSGGGVNHTVAVTMAEFGASGHYDTHLTAARQRYAAQRDALVDALAASLPSLPFVRPAGGWFVWPALPPPLSARALLPVAEGHGVSYLDGPRFHVDGRGDDRLRLSFSMLGPTDLRLAVDRLAAAVRELS